MVFACPNSSENASTAQQHQITVTMAIKLAQILLEQVQRLELLVFSDSYILYK